MTFTSLLLLLLLLSAATGAHTTWRVIRSSG
jgi:hypothetical protein